MSTPGGYAQFNGKGVRWNKTNIVFRGNGRGRRRNWAHSTCRWRGRGGKVAGFARDYDIGFVFVGVGGVSVQYTVAVR